VNDLDLVGIRDASRAGGASVNGRSVVAARRSSGAVASAVHENLAIFRSGFREQHGDVSIVAVDRAKAKQAPIRAILHRSKIYVSASCRCSGEST
jgi:hypothetical protein